MALFHIYILYNNFVNNQYLNLKLNYISQKCCLIDFELKVIKYLLHEMLFVQI